MEKHGDSEKREYLRLDSTYIVSYRPTQGDIYYDITQVKNIGQGGLLFNVNRKFEKGSRLILILRLPFLPPKQKVEVACEVIDSKGIRTGSTYEARVKFLNLDKDIFQKLKQFIEGRKDEKI